MWTLGSVQGTCVMDNDPAHQAGTNMAAALARSGWVFVQSWVFSRKQRRNRHCDTTVTVDEWTRRIKCWWEEVVLSEQHTFSSIQITKELLNSVSRWFRHAENILLSTLLQFFYLFIIWVTFNITTGLSGSLQACLLAFPGPAHSRHPCFPSLTPAQTISAIRQREAKPRPLLMSAFYQKMRKWYLMTKCE